MLKLHILLDRVVPRFSWRSYHIVPINFTRPSTRSQHYVSYTSYPSHLGKEAELSWPKYQKQLSPPHSEPKSSMKMRIGNVDI